jgi:hypothetical protein
MNEWVAAHPIIFWTILTSFMAAYWHVSTKWMEQKVQQYYNITTKHNYTIKEFKKLLWAGSNAETAYLFPLYMVYGNGAFLFYTVLCVNLWEVGKWMIA